MSFLTLSCNRKSNEEALADGLEEIVAGNLYVMHSMIYQNNDPWTTSNIFLIKGTNDTVWIFGSGYGDFYEGCIDDCNDNNYYLGKEFHGTGPAIEDVKPLDSIIQNVFHTDKDDVVLQFIVPHYHNDHINSEFIDAFHSHFSYSVNQNEKIWVHVNDFYGATCDEPCCGTQPCPDKKNKFYGVPYKPSWNTEYKNLFTAIGSENDTCNQIIKSFTSEIGIWQISKGVAVKDDGHTDGTINLNNSDLKLRINGTKSKVQCSIPNGWDSCSVHGNIHLN